MLSSSLLVLAAAGSLTLASPTPKPTTSNKNNNYAATEARQTSSRAQVAIEGLQEWYNQRTGLWETAGWWQSANALTAVGDFALAGLQSNVETRQVFENTFSRAQTNGARVVKERSESVHGIARSYFSPSSGSDNSNSSNNNFTVERRSAMGHADPAALVSAQERGFQGFINEYYDDEGWWALGLLKGHDLGFGPAYIDMANSIFADMRGGKSPCGGIFWSKTSAYTNAIANELFLFVSAALANRMPEGYKQTYLDAAQEQWAWFKQSGMINDRKLINDGLFDWNDADESRRCRNNGGAVWSYNQGVILGALVELARATGDESVIDEYAKPIARAAMAELTSTAGEGVLSDPCDPSNNCGGDGASFKGVFMRNLQYLHKAYPEQDFAEYIRRQADSIWDNARGDGNKFGLVWTGPYTRSDAITQTIALDTFVGAESI